MRNEESTTGKRSSKGRDSITDASDRTASSRDQGCRKSINRNIKIKKSSRSLTLNYETPFSHIFILKYKWMPLGIHLYEYFYQTVQLHTNKSYFSHQTIKSQTSSTHRST